MPNKLVFCSLSTSVLCRQGKIVVFMFSTGLHFELDSEHNKEMFLQEPWWSHLLSTCTPTRAKSLPAKTHCCPASLLTILVSELCFYFYKPLLCFLHQTGISVCVVVLDTGSWDLCGIYKLILSSSIWHLCLVEHNSIFKGTRVPHLPLLSLDVQTLKSWNMPWSQILQLYPDTPC